VCPLLTRVVYCGCLVLVLLAGLKYFLDCLVVNATCLNGGLVENRDMNFDDGLTSESTVTVMALFAFVIIIICKFM